VQVEECAGECEADGKVVGSLDMFVFHDHTAAPVFANEKQFALCDQYAVPLHPSRHQLHWWHIYFDVIVVDEAISAGVLVEAERLYGAIGGELIAAVNCVLPAPQ